MRNLTVENVYTRHDAKILTKRYFWKLLAMLIVVGLISYGLIIGGTLLLSAATGVNWQVQTVGNSVSVNVDPDSLNPTFNLCYSLLTLVAALVSTGLSLGLTRSTIDLCRDREHVKIRRVFSRLGQCLKGIGLSIVIVVKILLWAIPGFVVTGVGYYFVLETKNETLTLLLPLVSLLLIFGLTVPAGFRYALSTHMMADQRIGVFASVRQSKALMKGHKWQLFKLNIPFVLMQVLWSIIIAILVALSALLLSNVDPELFPILTTAGGLAGAIVALVYTLRSLMAVNLFYLKRVGDKSPIPVEEAERIVCWQPGAAAQPAGTPISADKDDHIAYWQPTENKPDQE